MTSARGDSRAASSGKGMMATCRSEVAPSCFACLGGRARAKGVNPKVSFDFCLCKDLGGGAKCRGARPRLSVDFCFCTGFGGGAKCRGANPNAPSDDPNLCAPKPGDGGGLENGSGGGKPGDIGGLAISSGASPGEGGILDIEMGAGPGERGGFDNVKEPKPGDGGGFECVKEPNPGDGGGLFVDNEKELNPGDGGALVMEGGGKPGDGGGLERELTDDANPESGCEATRKESMLNRPNLPGSASSSFSVHEKLEGAEDGPGEIGSPLFGVEFPRARDGLRSGLVAFEPLSSTGRGAVKGSLGGSSIWSADSVALCFVGLRPDRGLKPALGANLLFDTSF